MARATATAINTTIQTPRPYACRPLAGDYVNYWASSFRNCGEKRLFYPEATLARDRFVSLMLCATISLHCIDDSVKHCKATKQLTAWAPETDWLTSGACNLLAMRPGTNYSEDSILYETVIIHVSITW